MATFDWKARARELVKGFERVTIDEAAAAIAVTWIVTQMLVRLRYGVDATDEAFYCALTHRYALGDWPYLDEVNLRQTAGLFAVPVYWVYLKIQGNTDGVVILLRGVYFVITCVVGWAVYGYAQPRVGRPVAMLAAVTPIAFFPFALPTCSYNNLGCMMFTMGSFLGLRAAMLEGARARRVHYWAGIVHGLALVAYPPYIVPVAAFGALQLAAVRDDRWRRTRQYFFGGATIGVLFALVLARAGIHGVHEAFEYETALVPPRTESKFIGVLTDILNHAPGQPAAIPFVLAWIAAAKAWRGFRIWGTLALIPLLGWIYAPVSPAPPPPAFGTQTWGDTTMASLLTAPTGLESHVRCLYYAVYACLAAAVVLPLLPRGAERRELTLMGWIPSLVAALTTGYASANTGATNAGLGAFSGAVVTLVAIPMAIGKGAQPEPAGESRPLGSRIVGAVLVASIATAGLAHLRYAYRSMYRDASIENLDERVTMGPYKGLYTTHANAWRMSVMVRKLRQLERSDGKVLAYYDYPAVYLMTEMKPAMPSIWTDARIPISDFMIQRYIRNVTGHGFIVRMTGVENRNGRSKFEQTLEAPERLEYTDEYFKIYSEPDPSLLK